MRKIQDRWHCTNSACGREIQVERNESIKAGIPRCPCGGALKKRYASPALTYLDFLRLEEMPKVGSRKE
jgi:hypothetical protein